MNFTREKFHGDLEQAARKLTPVERRGLEILLTPRRQLIARVEERLDRGSPREPEAVPAPVWMVRGYDDPAGRHAAYRSALRTLCGLRVERGLRGRSGQGSPPDCAACAAALDEHRLLGLVRDRDAPSCPALTKLGKPCKRPPLECGYCPSHQRLAA